MIFQLELILDEVEKNWLKFLLILLLAELIDEIMLLLKETVYFGIQSFVKRSLKREDSSINMFFLALAGWVHFHQKQLFLFFALFGQDVGG